MLSNHHTSPLLLPVVAAIAFTLVSACSSGNDSVDGFSEAEQWEAADALFRTDPRWLGADGAYSVDLGEERRLWVFGDTFVAVGDGDGTRNGSRLVRNTVAIQDGADPATASIEFYWEDGEEPAAYFGEEGERWYWPASGIVIDGELTLFWLDMKQVDTDWGFEVAGWKAYRVKNSEDSPSDWDFEELDGGLDDDGIVVGSMGVHTTDDYIYAVGSSETRNHDVFVCRWEREAFVEGNLAAPEWWYGTSEGWKVRDGTPRHLFKRAQTEGSVFYHEKSDQFLAVYSQGFGSTTIAVRTAPAIEGPWSNRKIVFEPPESDRDDVMVYAAKAHPGLHGDDLVMTYVANATDFWDLFDDDTIYYPRFVRMASLLGL